MVYPLTSMSPCLMVLGLFGVCGLSHTLPAPDSGVELANSLHQLKPSNPSVRIARASDGQSALKHVNQSSSSHSSHGQGRPTPRSRTPAHDVVRPDSTDGPGSSNESCKRYWHKVLAAVGYILNTTNAIFDSPGFNKSCRILGALGIPFGRDDSDTPTTANNGTSNVILSRDSDKGTTVHEPDDDLISRLGSMVSGHIQDKLNSTRSFLKELHTMAHRNNQDSFSGSAA